jgi:restriction endonuclease Mrr
VERSFEPQNPRWGLWGLFLWGNSPNGNGGSRQDAGQAVGQSGDEGIDGERLSELMIDHNIGVTEAASYVVKKIDLDYFEED